MFIVTGILWLIFTILICCMAKSYGRSAIGFFFLSLFLSPVVGLIILLIMGKDKPAVVEVRYADTPKPAENTEDSVQN